MRQEADDRRSAFELGLDLGDQGKRLGVGVVQIEEDEGGPIFFPGLGQLGHNILLRFEEGDLDAEFLRDFLDLGQDEEVFDETVDPGGRILAHGYGLDIVGFGVEAAVRHAAKVVVGRVGGGVGDIAVGSAAIAVIHGTDKDLLTATLVLAASAGVSVPIAVAGRRTEAVTVVAALATWALL